MHTLVLLLLFQGTPKYTGYITGTDMVSARGEGWLYGKQIAGGRGSEGAGKRVTII